MTLTLNDLHRFGSWHALNTAYANDRHKLCHNTYVRQYQSPMKGVGRVYAVRYHNTDIATFYPDDTVELNTNGWDTTTTKRRLNELLNRHQVYIYQRDYVWYVQLGSYNNPNAETVEYYDGMVIDLSTALPTIVEAH